MMWVSIATRTGSSLPLAIGDVLNAQATRANFWLGDVDAESGCKNLESHTKANLQAQDV